MVVEVMASIGAGLMAGSFALLAFGSDSVVELISSSSVVWHLQKDAGGSEHLGRRTARFTSLLLLALLPIIGLSAGYSYLIGVRPEGSAIGIVVGAGAVVLMPYFWLRKKEIGQETNCLPLTIDAVESATCFFMSVALLGGLLAEYFLGLWWVDYLATGIILGFIAKEWVESDRELREEGRGPLQRLGE